MMMSILPNTICLHNMFEKKKFFEGELTKEEEGILARVQNSLLLRSLIDPSLPFGMPENYVPSRLELELAYVAVSGRLSEKTISIKDLVRIVGIATECGKDLHIHFKFASAL